VLKTVYLCRSISTCARPDDQHRPHASPLVR